MLDTARFVTTVRAALHVLDAAVARALPSGEPGAEPAPRTRVGRMVVALAAELHVECLRLPELPAATEDGTQLDLGSAGK